MAGVFGCGYARVAVKLSTCKESGKVEQDLDQRFINFTSVFAGKFESNFKIDREQYVKKYKDLINVFKKWKTKEKHVYTSHFSPEKWKALPQIQKQQHSLQSCRACNVHHFAIQSKFPTKSNLLIAKNEALVLKDSTNKPVLQKQPAVKPTQTAIREAARKCYQNINKSFQKVFDVSFSEALTKIKEIGLEKKLSKTQSKSALRKHRREEKKHISMQWQENEALTFLANRKPFQQYDSERKALFFESKDEAKRRNVKRKMMEDNGNAKRKRHSPEPDTLNFDKDGLLQEVSTKKDGEEVSNNIVTIL